MDFLQYQKPKSELRITGSNDLVFMLPSKQPNWWFRMWQRLILGFRWTACQGNDENA